MARSELEYAGGPSHRLHKNSKNVIFSVSGGVDILGINTVLQTVQEITKSRVSV